LHKIFALCNHLGEKRELGREIEKGDNYADREKRVTSHFLDFVRHAMLEKSHADSGDIYVTSNTLYATSKYFYSFNSMQGGR